jgi:hypothetical protein
MIESHADVCRLGYFRLIPVLSMLSGENKVIRQNFLARSLFECLQKVNGSLEKPRISGIITGLTNARNYIAVAQKLGLVEKTGPGLFGKIYLCLDSAKSFEEFVKGERELSLDDILELSPPERVLFMWVIFGEDFPFPLFILKFAFQKRDFRRIEAMDAIMEEIYPGWKEKRLATKPSDWIYTREYNLAYHTVFPRLEFLVDLGFLVRTGRGRYEISRNLLPNSNIILRMCDEKNRKKMEEEIFNKMPRVVGEASEPRRASEAEIREEMFRAYSRYSGLNKFGNPRFDILVKLTALLLLERGRHATISEIRTTFDKLFTQFPNRVSIAIEGDNV